MKSFPYLSPSKNLQKSKIYNYALYKAKSAHSIERDKYMKIMAFLNVSSAERSQLYLLFSNYYLLYCI